MPDFNRIPDFRAMGDAMLRDARIYAETTGENFFKDTFAKGGFTDQVFEQWADPKAAMPGYKTLQVTGALRDSVGVMESTPQQIVFGSDMPYAEIHNEGGLVTIRITDRMRRYFWFMYKATGVEMWKAMAITKKEAITFTMPQRKFIGESATLMADLDQWFSTELLLRFKQL